MTRKLVYLDALLEKIEPLPKEESGHHYHVMVWVHDLDVPIRGVTVGAVGANRIVKAMEEINESVGHMAIWGVIMPIVKFRRK